MKTCFSCRADVDSPARPGRMDACGSCGASLKVCLNCAFYERSSAGECREPSAERVAYKDKPNFCEFFIFRESADGKACGKDEKKDPLWELKSLFKG